MDASTVRQPAEGSGAEGRDTRGSQMAGFTPFTSNYNDLSDENGYQFEFHCDICGSG